MVLMLAFTLGLTEASGVTKVVPTVIRIVRGEGTLVIEVDDPTVQVSLDGEALSIRGAGLQELRLIPGDYRVHATKDGRPVKDEVVTITRDGRKVVTVTRERSAGSHSPTVAPAVEPPVGELKLLEKLDWHAGLVRAVAFLPDDRRVVSVGHDQMVHIWDMANRSILATLPVEGNLATADVSADGRLVATLRRDDSKGLAHIWDIEKRKVVCQFVPELNFDNFFRFSPDGTRLVTSGTTLPYAVLWDTASGRELGHFDSGDPIKSMHRAAFSPNGRMLALGADGRVRLFDIESEGVLADVRLPNTGGVGDLVFAPSGKALATGQYGGHVTLIDVNARRVLKTLQGSSANVRSLRFLGSDRFLLTSSYDATLRVWDLEQERILARAVTGNGMNHGLFVSPDGRHVLTAGGKEGDGFGGVKDHGDYALRLWQLPETVWPKQATAAASSKERAIASSEPGAFVRLGGQGVAERKFDTLAEAVQFASGGDTIEIRGNGPFVTGPIKLPAVALTIRAGEGYRPVIEAGPDAWDNIVWIWAHAPLILEGLEFRGSKSDPQKPGEALKVETNSRLSVTHCRFVFLLPRVNPIDAGGSNCEIRHCEFVLGRIANHAVLWHPGRDRRLTVDGCIVAGRGLNLVLGYRGALAEPCSVEFTRNTVTGPWAIQLMRLPDIAAQGQRLSLQVADNVFDCPTFMSLADWREVPLLAPAAALAFVKQLVAYEEQRNIHSGGGRLLEYIGKKWTALSPHGTVNDLEAWQQFWGQQATTSRTGSVHFEGGAAVAYANLNLNSREVTPADFRLRPDSAGYRAGPDGKDLGADVDLVGPGPAYERWKKTPEYQQWLKETGQEK